MSTTEPTEADTQQTVQAVERFNEAFARHDVEAVMAAMTGDCVFESTTPPDGERFEGHEAVAACWRAFFADNPSATFTAEEVTALGDRATVRWHYQWGRDGSEHVRGVDLLRIWDGKVAEKLSYVKG